MARKKKQNRNRGPLKLINAATIRENLVVKRAFAIKDDEPKAKQAAYAYAKKHGCVVGRMRTQSYNEISYVAYALNDALDYMMYWSMLSFGELRDAIAELEERAQS